jgi:hypothetical protein
MAPYARNWRVFAGEAEDDQIEVDNFVTNYDPHDFLGQSFRGPEVLIPRDAAASTVINEGGSMMMRGFHPPEEAKVPERAGPAFTEQLSDRAASDYLVLNDE